jgi:hypothetical protein
LFSYSYYSLRVFSEYYFQVIKLKLVFNKHDDSDKQKNILKFKLLIFHIFRYFLFCFKPNKQKVNQYQTLLTSKK